jgi:hypothetical protein
MSPSLDATLDRTTIGNATTWPSAHNPSVKALSSKEIVGTAKTHDSLVCNRCSLPQHSPCPPLAPCHSSLPMARDENGAKMGRTFEWVDSGFQLNQIEVAPHLDIFPKKKIDV